MIDHTAEGLISCPHCDAMVPSFESLSSLPPDAEQYSPPTPRLRPFPDPAMHNPGCTHCHDAEKMESFKSGWSMMECFDKASQKFNKLTVGSVLNSIDQVLNVDANITTKNLVAARDGMACPR